MDEDGVNYKNIYLFIDVDSMLLCLCSVIDHRRCQNMVKISVTCSATSRVLLIGLTTL